ncbi:MAG: hypothetical protein RLO52_12300 [Sandaracinaceae bacterium]
MYLGVVLNPLARRNRKDRGARARRLRRLLGPWGEVHETPSIDALSGTLEGLLPRATHLVSDGGDGALHWMINTVRALRGEDERWPTFVPTNGGTIDFVARKVGVRGRSESIVRALTAFAMAGREPEEVTLDSLLLTGALEDGTPFDRVGFALAAGGVGNRFFDKYYADPAPSPTTIAKVIGRTVSEWTAARVAPGLVKSDSYAAHLFRPTRALVTIDGERVEAQQHGGLHAGAFDINLGGVVRVFPLAKEPGVMHFQAGEIDPAGIIANLPAIVSGGAIQGPKLRDTSGREMIIEALDEPLSPIVDGERFEGLRRLEVRAGPPVRIARVRA